MFWFNVFAACCALFDDENVLLKKKFANKNTLHFTLSFTLHEPLNTGRYKRWSFQDVRSIWGYNLVLTVCLKLDWLTVTHNLNRFIYIAFLWVKNVAKSITNLLS